LELAPVEVPEAFAETMTVAVRDLGHAAVNGSGVPPVVQIELRHRQDERADDAEQEDPDQQARTDAAAQSIETTPGRHGAVFGRGLYHTAAAPTIRSRPRACRVRRRVIQIGAGWRDASWRSWWSCSRQSPRLPRRRRRCGW